MCICNQTNAYSAQVHLNSGCSVHKIKGRKKRKEKKSYINISPLLTKYSEVGHILLEENYVMCISSKASLVLTYMHMHISGNTPDLFHGLLGQAPSKTIVH